jgi:dimethylglycine dehydrogenase
VNDRYDVVVIGGGIVGCSVLYHLTLRGLTEVALIEREELTAGSTWHAAGAFHAMNADTRIAALQDYTIGLYPQIEAESGQDVGLHMSGSVKLAGTHERFQWLKAQHAWLRTQGTDASLLTPAEAAEMVPIIDQAGLVGALFDPFEGYLDPNGATRAFAIAARARGADVIEHDRVVSLSASPGDGWRVETERGRVEAGHVVNAAGLWARRVGRMVGIDHPIAPMPHHYLVTDTIAEVAAIKGEMPKVIDLEGFTYLRREGNGLLLGVYEQDPRHWQIDGAPWDYGRTLFAEEPERIMPELSIGFARYPVLANTGIRRWVNGAVTFTPDGNPLVGPVDGIPGYWAACGVMAGFSQCSGIGLALANWIVDGDPGYDIYGMDVARFGPYASNDRYLRDTTRQFYARRFVMSYPNQELLGGRPLKTTPCYDDLLAAGARFTVNHGMEVPLYFAPAGFEEHDTLMRSNAEPIVAEEVAAVRTAAGAAEIAHYARYEVTGHGAQAWLDRLLASSIPEVGRIKLAPMLNEAGRLMGDLSVSRLDEQLFWLTGSYYLQAWHMRWFRRHLPTEHVELRNITDGWMGFSVSGPSSRAILERLVHGDVSLETFGLFAIGSMDVGSARAVVGRISLTGEAGYEIVVPANQHRTLLHELREAGEGLGLRLVGGRAVRSLRLEKGYGVWSAEFRQDVTPAMAGLDRFIAFETDFIGRDAAMREQEGGGPAQRLALLAVDTPDADAARDDGVWAGDRLVGLVTSGAYGHHVGMSLALAHLGREILEAGADLTVFVVGEPRPARVLTESPYDPAGTRLREPAGAPTPTHRV